MKSTRRLTNRNSGAPSFLRAYTEFAGAATTRRRSESRLNAARVEAEMSNRAKSEFMAHMSHDLRTPLNAIIGFSDVLANTEMASANTGKAKEYAGDINHAGKHLLRIINDILDLARLESGRPDLDLEPCDLRDVLHTTTVIAKPQAEAKLQLLSSFVEDDLPRLQLDPLRTKQIVINLVSNAVKFSPVGGVIRMSAERSDDLGVVLTVADSGPGMTAEELEVAMTRFGRVRNSMTRGQEGTGLGLTIVSHLCQALGARFQLWSRPGEGTRARVHFPRSIIVSPDN
ncbi:MAG: HAMP domain-containing sensor histidine kinase [Micropepsaceae bacterium]